MNYEPTHLEMFLTKLAFAFFGKSVYRSFADSLPLDGREQVLDFGCGMGNVACHVAKKLPNGRLTCLDVSERWLKACRKTLRRFGNVVFLKWESPVLAHERYDVVYCHFVLHEIPDFNLEEIISVLAASLKPGGLLVFRESLRGMAKINVIKRLIEQNALLHKDSRVTYVPVVGTTLESVYVKEVLL